MPRHQRSDAHEWINETLYYPRPLSSATSKHPRGLMEHEHVMSSFETDNVLIFHEFLRVVAHVSGYITSVRVGWCVQSGPRKGRQHSDSSTSFGVFFRGRFVPPHFVTMRNTHQNRDAQLQHQSS